MKKFISTVFLIGILCLLFSCGNDKPTDEELIEARIIVFCDSYNDGDWEGVLECLDAKSRNTIEGTLNLVGGILGGISMSDLFGMSVGFISEGDLLEVEVSEVKLVSDTSAIATVKMKYEDKYSSTSEILYFVMLYEDGGLYIQNMTSNASEIPESPIKTSKGEVIPDEIGEFYDGRALVSYKKSGDKYWGVIDAEGNIYYSAEGEIALHSSGHMGNGAVYACITENSETVYVIINSDGECTVTSKDGDFDEIISGCDGYALAYKYNSSITEIEYLYGIIDGDGNWETSLRGAGEYLSFSKLLFNTDDSTFWTSDTNNNYYLYDFARQKEICRISGASYYGSYDGAAYFKSGYIYIDGSGNNMRDLCYRVYGSGIYKETVSYDYITDGMAIYVEDDSVMLLDIQTGKTGKYADYPASRVDNIEFLGDLAIVRLSGVDGKKYFTLIDKNGNQKFEPIEYEAYAYFCGETVLYFSEYDAWGDDDKCCVADSSGEAIAENLEYSYVSTGFSNGFAKVSRGNDYIYINKNGEQVFKSLKEK